MYGELEEESHRSFAGTIPSAKRQEDGEEMVIRPDRRLHRKVVTSNISESI
jgi:hypothetical protein